MPWYRVFQDGPEYEERKRKGTFVPPNIAIKDLHDAVPPSLFERSTVTSLFYIARHLAFTYTFYVLAIYLDTFYWVVGLDNKTFVWKYLMRPTLWLHYWGWQGIAFAGIWCLGHEAGHNALSPNPVVNSFIGCILHTFVLTPYYSWRATHRRHHKSANSLERDETYHPQTRKELNLSDGRVMVRLDYAKMLEETPACTLFKLIVRQFLGFQLYLFHNRKGNPRYPPGTSHYKPSSLLFKPEEGPLVVASNTMILSMTFLLGIYAWKVGWSFLLVYYIMPWLFAHNWIVMFTYLQHSDPTVPYYRKDQWTFARGALATVDRPLFGWVGRFFLHNISSDHIAHHFFASVPFYNLPEVTNAIKPVLGDCYNYDSTPAIRALWRSFRECIFVEDRGDVVFFKDRCGESTIKKIETEDLKKKNRRR